MHRIRAIAVAAFAFGAASCGGAAPRVEPRPPPPPPAADLGELPDRDFGELRSKRFAYVLDLPDAANWRVDDQTDRWLVAMHTPSKSMLVLRAWREGSVMDHRSCEAEARRLRRDLFGATEDALGDRRRVAAPEGYDAEVGFLVNRKGEALAGVAALSAANVRRCLAVAYATRASGAGAEAAVASRLEFVAARVFAGIRERGIEERVEREIQRERGP